MRDERIEWKMQGPLISVIVPIYNSEKYLDKCINSICTQTYKNIEIILIDDGSSDGSLEICLEHQKTDSRIQVYSGVNEGLINARKNGIVHANGELIGFVDSDDWIEDDMYLELIRIFMKTDSDMVSSGIMFDYEEGNSSHAFDNYDEGYYADLDRYIYPTMLHDESIRGFGLKCNLVNKIFKKELLKKVYLNINTDIFYGEDCLTLCSYCLLAKSVYILKKSYYHYNIRNDSMCYRKDERLLENSYLLYTELKKIFNRYKEPYVFFRQLKKYILKIEFHNLEILYDIKVGALGDWKFDYEKEVQDSKIVIYGAGGCGQAFYQYLQSRKLDSHVVAWVDKNPSNKSEQCFYQIETPDKITKIKFDVLIIAILIEEVAMEIREELLKQYPIKGEQVIWKQPEHIPFI